MQRLKTAIIACALAAALVSPVSAKTEILMATTCWTGNVEMISTTQEDMGWTYLLSYTSLAHDNDAKKSVSGRCVSSGGLVGGTHQSAPFFCTALAADGSTYMAKGTGGPTGSKATLFGGTGAFVGISGTVTGGPRIKLPASKGHFANCSHDVMERTLPD